MVVQLCKKIMNCILSKGAFYVNYSSVRIVKKVEGNRSFLKQTKTDRINCQQISPGSLKEDLKADVKCYGS